MLVEQTRVIAGDWGPDGMVYFGLVGGGIGRVAATGGEVEVLTSPDTLRGELSHTTVDVLPNGKGALITIWHGQFSDAEIAILEFSTGAIRVLDRGMHPRYAQSGHVVYLREDLVLLAAPFDQINLELVGSANVLTEEVGRSISVGVGEYSISETGTLLKVEHQEGQRQPVWVDRDGREGVIDPEWKGGFDHPALSPDGTRLAVSTGGHIWIKDLPYGQPTQLTFEGSSNQPPVWSLDGQRLIYLSTRNREYGFWEKQAAGTSAATLVLPVETYAQSMSWSKDGTWLVYQLRRPTGGGRVNDIFGYQPDLGGSPIPLVATDFDEKNPTLSPDGRWLAYDSNRSGQYEVYVRPFPIVDGDVRFRVSNEGGVQPSWAHNGHELFYVNGDDELVAVEFEAGQTFRPLTENPLFSLDGYYFWPGYNHSFAVDVNDDRFLMLKFEESWELSLTFNFFEELKQRVENGSD